MLSSKNAHGITLAAALKPDLLKNASGVKWSFIRAQHEIEQTTNNTEHTTSKT